MARIFRLEHQARAGFAARGIIYLSLGWLTFSSMHGAEAGGALERLHAAPFGGITIIALAVGLLGYGLWRIVGGVIDLDDEGRSAYGIVTRIGLVISGLGHLALCALAIHIATWGHAGPDGGEERAARTAFEYPGGAWLVGIVGIIIVVSGAGQILIALRGGYMKFLMDRSPLAARLSGFAGYLARGSVFIVIGWQVISLAVGWGGQRLGFESALDIIARREWVFPFVAAGLFLFGVFSLMAAWYLRIRDEDVKRRAALTARWWRRLSLSEKAQRDDQKDGCQQGA